MSDVKYDKMQLRFIKRKSHQGVSLTDYDLDENNLEHEQFCFF